MAQHMVKHSTGFVIARATPTSGVEWSFKVAGGVVTELTGWHRAGPVPEVDRNPPANDQAVLTVLVEDDDLATFRALGLLKEVHVKRYGECRLHLAGELAASKPWRDWLAKGGPVVELPKDEDSDGDDGDSDEDDELEEEHDDEPPASEEDLEPEPEPEPAEPDVEAELKAASKSDIPPVAGDLQKEANTAVPGVDRSRAQRARQAKAKRAKAKAKAAAKKQAKPPAS